MPVAWLTQPQARPAPYAECRCFAVTKCETVLTLSQSGGAVKCNAPGSLDKSKGVLAIEVQAAWARSRSLARTADGVR